MSDETTTTETAADSEQDAAPTPEAVEDGTLGDAGKKALDAMKAERNAAKRERDAIKARLDEIERAGLSDLERAQQEAQEARARLSEYERTNLLQRVAIEKGVPAELVGRLRGETEDDISADADALMALVNAPKAPRPDPTQGGRGAAPASTGEQFASAVGDLFT